VWEEVHVDRDIHYAIEDVVDVVGDTVDQDRLNSALAEVHN
jgi:hypothetical protein